MTGDQIVMWVSLCALAWWLSALGTLTFLMWREDRRWRKWWRTGMSK